MLPKFCVDGEHRAALVVGRAADLGPLSEAAIQACVDVARAQAELTGLALTFVIAAAPGVDPTYAGAAAGLLVSDAIQDRPTEVRKEALSRHRPSDVPESFWKALADAGASLPPATEDDDPEAPREGLFLVPGGWSIARLFLGKRVSQEEIEAAENEGLDPPESSAERVLGAAAEDTTPTMLVSPELISKIQASSEPLVLEADYC